MSYPSDSKSIFRPRNAYKKANFLSKIEPNYYSKTNFEYHSEDGQGEHGFIYYLGTKGYSQDYRPPLEIPNDEKTSLTLITSPPLSKYGVHLEFSNKVGNLEPIYLLMKSPSQIGYLGMRDIIYFDIFFPVLFKPNHYSLWNTDDPHQSNQFALYNWKLLGWSESLEDWVCIKDHVNDKTVDKSKKFARGDFPLDCTEYFTHFRILSTGQNQWGRHAGLMISRIEFYGLVQQVINGDKILELEDKNIYFHFVDEK